MSRNIKIEQVRKLIGESKLREAMERLHELCNGPGQTNELISFMAHYNDLSKAMRTQTKHSDEIASDNKQFIESLLLFTDDVDRSIKSSRPESVSLPSLKKSWLIFFVIITCMILVSGIYLIDFTPDDQRNIAQQHYPQKIIGSVTGRNGEGLNSVHALISDSVAISDPTGEFIFTFKHGLSPEIEDSLYVILSKKAYKSWKGYTPVIKQGKTLIIDKELILDKIMINTSSVSEEKVKGFLKDYDTGEVLEGAMISCQGHVTYSDSDGSFSIAIRDNGIRETLRVNKENYHPYLKYISISEARQILNISLHQISNK